MRILRPCAILAALLLATSSAQSQTVGLYFDALGTQPSIAESAIVFPAVVTAFVIAKDYDPVVGIRAWEMRLSWTDSLIVSAGGFSGQGINVGTFPEYRVGLAAPIGLNDDLVVLAQVNIYALGPGDLILGACSLPSIPLSELPVCEMGGSLWPMNLEFGGVGLACASIGREAGVTENLNVLALSSQYEAIEFHDGALYGASGAEKGWTQLPRVPAGEYSGMTSAEWDMISLVPRPSNHPAKRADKGLVQFEEGFESFLADASEPFAPQYSIASTNMGSADEQGAKLLWGVSSARARSGTNAAYCCAVRKTCGDWVSESSCSSIFNTSEAYAPAVENCMLFDLPDANGTRQKLTFSVWSDVTNDLGRLLVFARIPGEEGPDYDLPIGSADFNLQWGLVSMNIPVGLPDGSHLGFGFYSSGSDSLESHAGVYIDDIHVEAFDSDLRIVSAVVQEANNVSEPNTVFVEIANDGTLPSGAFAIAFARDSVGPSAVFEGRREVPSLDAGASTVIAVGVACSSEALETTISVQETIWFEVDSDHGIPEVDEQNNLSAVTARWLVEDRLPNEECPFYDSPPALRLFGWTVPEPGDISDIAVSSEGDVFIVDGWNGQIHKYSTAGAYQLSWTVNQGREHDARFIALDESGSSAAGSVYVRGDLAAQVYRYDTNGNLLSIVSPTTGGGIDEFTAGSHGPIAVDTSGYLYVVDVDTDDPENPHNRIKKYLPGGVSPGVVVEDPPSPAPGNWIAAWDLAVAADGTIFLADAGYPPVGPKIEVFAATGGYLRTLAVPVSPSNLRVEIDNDAQTLWVHENDDLVIYDLFGVEQDRITYHALGSTGCFARCNGTPDFLFTGVYLEPYRFMVSVYGREPTVINVMKDEYVDASFQLRDDEPELLAQCVADTVWNLAADGVATVVHRLNVPGPGRIGVELTSVTDESCGEYAPLGASFGATAIEFDAVEIDGEWVAMFKHRAPPDYDDGAKRESRALDGEKVSNRIVDVHWTFYTDQPNMNGGIVSGVRLVRPPVIFVHGLWDRAYTWENNFEGVIKDPAGRWACRLFDYENTNGAAVQYNAMLLKNEIRRLRGEFSKQKTVVGQFDFIAHSMGGILLRTLADEGLNGALQYADASNLGQGDYNKILFFNTPHGGSPLARKMHELGEGLRNGTLSGGESLAVLAIEQALARLVGLHDRSQLYGDAVRDLSDTSPLIASLGALDVPSYAYIGTSGFDERLGSAVVGQYLAFMVMSRLDDGIATQYASSLHDGVVLRDSQVGGFDNGHFVEYGLECGDCGRHMHTFSHEEAWQTAEDFELLPVDSQFLQQTIPAGGGKASAAKATAGIPVYAGDGFDITVFGGFTAGGMVTLQVTPRTGFDCDEYFVTMNGYGVRFESGDLSRNVTLPQEWVGDITIGGLAFTTTGELVTAPDLTRTTYFSATLQAVRAEPADLRLDRLGAQERISVYGTYSDGVERRLNDTGAVSWNPDPSLDGGVLLEPDGTLVALGACEGTIAILYQGRSTSVAVTVEDGGRLTNVPHARVSDSTPDGRYCGNTTICFDAGESFDYDTLLDDHLEYDWDLDGDGTFDDASGVQPCVLFEASQDTVVYGVRVRDQQSNESYAYGYIVPVSGDCLGADVVCSIHTVNTGRDYIEVGGDGLIYSSKGGGEWLEIFGPDCTAVDVRDVDVQNEIGVDAAGIVYFRPNYPGAPANTFARLHPDGTQDELPVTGLVGVTLDMNLIECGPDGDLYVDGRPYGGGRAVYRVNTQGEFVSACVVNWPSYFSINQFDVDGDASVYVLIYASDKKNIVKYEQNGGVYQRDTDWGTAGVVTIADCYEIKDIAVSDGGWLCAFHSPTAYGEGTIDIYDPAGVLAEQRNAFSNGLPFESIINFEYLADGKFVLAPLGEDMVVTQLLPAPVSAVGDNPSPSEGSARGGAVLRLPFGAWQGGVTPIFCSLSRDVARLQVDVYDLRGAHVRTIWSGARSGGMQELSWDNRNSADRRMPSGVYLVKMEADGLVETGKIILLK